MSKLNANSVRVGNAIEHQGKLWRVLKTAHTMPGKGGAFVQLELKNIISGTKLNERFRSSEFVEVADLDTKDYQYLFANGDVITLMDSESYEQIEVSRDVVGSQAVFLQDGMILKAETHNGNIVGIELPETVTLEIAETEAVIKGQAGNASNKPAVLSNGAKTAVPIFISPGDKVVVRTIDASYVERAK